jgi:hypothetical protein
MLARSGGNMKLRQPLAAVVALALVTQADAATIGRDSSHPTGAPAPKHLAKSPVQRPVVFEPNVGQFAQGLGLHPPGERIAAR